jgi:hypothetical protein
MSNRGSVENRDKDKTEQGRTRRGRIRTEQDKNRSQDRIDHGIGQIKEEDKSQDT